MGWAILFLVLVVLVIILSISLINWKMQIHKVNVQLNAILNGETKKLVTISLTDRRLEHLVEIINQIVSKDNIYLGEIRKKEDELKENISCLSHEFTDTTNFYSRIFAAFIKCAGRKKTRIYFSIIRKSLEIRTSHRRLLSNLSFGSRTISILLWKKLNYAHCLPKSCWTTIRLSVLMELNRK